MNRTSAYLLVVDDSPSMRRLVSDLLHQLGFVHVDEAADGLDALAAFQRTPYDVIITDWNMPRMDGLELLKAVRRAPERADTAVLVLTGQVTAQRVKDALEAGADGFVAKPFVAPALADKVLRVVATLPPVLDFEPVLMRAPA